MTQHIPKADMHVHLEGTMMPEMVIKLANRHNLPVPHHFFNENKDGYVWETDGTPQGNLWGFVRAHDAMTAVIKTPDDYADITHDYLTRVARENCIYAEITIAPDLALMAGFSYADMCQGLAQGHARAKAETGIEARFISTCVRHFGPEAGLKAGRETHDHPHPLVTGFGMAGDENAHTVADFKPAYDAAGLSYRTAHAGEAAGPASVRDAKQYLGIRRFGHMVRAIEDAQLMQELQAINAVPEVCVSSNLVLGVYKNYREHPLRRFYDAGLKVVLGSDDPSFFRTSIGQEYAIAQEEFGFSDAELMRVTHNAIDEAFVDDDTRAQLRERLG